MTTEKVSDLKEVKLEDYFSPATFRLVPAEVAEQHGGISEVPVIINAHFIASKALIFNETKLQQFFGFARINKELQKLNEACYYSPAKGGILERITLNDSGALWIMVFEFFNSQKKNLLVSVKGDEVIKLLNDCRKPHQEAYDHF